MQRRYRASTHTHTCPHAPGAGAPNAGLGAPNAPKAEELAAGAPNVLFPTELPNRPGEVPPKGELAGVAEPASVRSTKTPQVGKRACAGTGAAGF